MLPDPGPARHSHLYLTPQLSSFFLAFPARVETGGERGVCDPKPTYSMTSAGVWGALPQSEGVAQAAFGALERVNSQLSANRVSDTDQSGSSISQDDEKGEEQIAKLARQLTLRSIQHPDGSYANPFNDSSDPALDPRSGQFKPEVWTKTLIGSAKIFSVKRVMLIASADWNLATPNDTRRGLLAYLLGT